MAHTGRHIAPFRVSEVVNPVTGRHHKMSLLWPIRCKDTITSYHHRMDQGRPIVDGVTKALGILNSTVPASFQRCSRQFLEEVAHSTAATTSAKHSRFRTCTCTRMLHQSRSYEDHRTGFLHMRSNSSRTSIIFITAT